MSLTIGRSIAVPSHYQSTELGQRQKPINMKILFVLLAVAIVASAHPERERRSVLGLPVIAPGTVVLGSAPGAAVVATPGHVGATLITSPAHTVVVAGHPLAHAVPALWG